jgi:hypothetical protein
LDNARSTIGDPAFHFFAVAFATSWREEETMGRNVRLALLVMVASMLGQSSASAGLPEKVEDGVMLHCHGWPFKAIEENLDRIAGAGFNSIQVSPIQAIRQPKPDEKTTQEPTGPWWLLYQPVSFKRIGNYKIGTEAELKSPSRRWRRGSRGVSVSFGTWRGAL